jgi:hypothetical protein
MLTRTSKLLSDPRKKCSVQVRSTCQEINHTQLYLLQATKGLVLLFLDQKFKSSVPAGPRNAGDGRLRAQPGDCKPGALTCCHQLVDAPLHFDLDRVRRWKFFFSPGVYELIWSNPKRRSTEEGSRPTPPPTLA